MIVIVTNELEKELHILLKYIFSEVVNSCIFIMMRHYEVDFILFPFVLPS